MIRPLRPVPVPASHRLFFALRPSTDAQARMGVLRDSLDERGTPVADQGLHMTLLALPDFAELPDGMVEAALEAAAGIEMAPFPVVLDRLVSGAHSALLEPSAPLDGLRLFRERLGFTLMRAGLGLRLGRRFNPHVTLLYNNWQVVAGEIAPIAWRAEEFVLIHSVAGTGRHEELGRWALRG